jgi:uncharacterized protein (TIGR03000 family)
MKKFVLVAALAWIFALGVAARPADAAWFGRRGGYYGYGYGGYRGYGGYGGYGYGGYYGSPYYGYGGWGYSPPYYAYGYSPYAASSYSVPYVAANYGWPSAYVGSTVTPASVDASNPQYAQSARDMTTYRSMYAPSQSANAATIRVEVPDPNARVYFDDAQTQQGGTDRVFMSPPLDPNKTYTYTVRATWMDNGKEVSRNKDVKVQAGRATMVDFRATRDSNENIPTPREDRPAPPEK